MATFLAFPNFKKLTSCSWKNKKKENQQMRKIKVTRNEFVVFFVLASILILQSFAMRDFNNRLKFVETTLVHVEELCQHLIERVPLK